MPTSRSTDAGAGLRAAGARHDEIEGAGLGLSICARAVRAHGGSIGRDAAPGGGALVWFELPRASVA